MKQSQFQQAAGISAGLAARWFPHIDAAMKEFCITAPLDQAMFIAQIGHESSGYEKVLEANPGLADRGAVYPSGLLITLPDMSPPVQESAFSLWD